MNSTFSAFAVNQWTKASLLDQTVVVSISGGLLTHFAFCASARFEPQKISISDNRKVFDETPFLES